jgi:hypothetical protein
MKSIFLVRYLIKYCVYIIYIDLKKIKDTDAGAFKEAEPVVRAWRRTGCLCRFPHPVYFRYEYVTAQMAGKTD